MNEEIQLRQAVYEYAKELRLLQKLVRDLPIKAYLVTVESPRLIAARLEDLQRVQRSVFEANRRLHIMRRTHVSLNRYVDRLHEAYAVGPAELIRVQRLIEKKLGDH